MRTDEIDRLASEAHEILNYTTTDLDRHEARSILNKVYSNPDADQAVCFLDVVDKLDGETLQELMSECCRERPGHGYYCASQGA